MLVLGYLFLPIFVIILYSFNKPAGKFNFVWKSFSLDAWRTRSRYAALVRSMKLSLRVAALSTLVATIFGALIALALCPLQVPRAAGRSACCWCCRSPLPKWCWARRCCRCSSTSTSGPGSGPS